MPFLVITIPWSPNIAQLGPFLLTWHGLFTAVGILGGVQLALWLARQLHYDEDDAYTLALVGVPSGVVGARLMFVAEHWRDYATNPVDIIAGLATGGISVWGAVLGGVAGSLLFARWRHYPIRRGLDIAGAGLILGMAIGRIGDLINGEHIGLATKLPWGVVYTHPLSPGLNGAQNIYGVVTPPPVHPATTYEMLADLVILGVVIWLARGPLRRRPGVPFFVFLVGYAVMRFFVTYLRVDSSITPVLGLRTPQLVSLLVVLGSIPVVLWLWRQPIEDFEAAPMAAAPPGRVPVAPRGAGPRRRGGGR